MINKSSQNSRDPEDFGCLFLTETVTGTVPDEGGNCPEVSKDERSFGSTAGAPPCLQEISALPGDAGGQFPRTSGTVPGFQMKIPLSRNKGLPVKEYI